MNKTNILSLLVIIAGCAPPPPPEDLSKAHWAMKGDRQLYVLPGGAVCGNIESSHMVRETWDGEKEIRPWHYSEFIDKASAKKAVEGWCAEDLKKVTENAKP